MLMQQQKVGVALITSQKNVQHGQHCVGVCLKGFVPNEAVLEELPVVLKNEFNQEAVQTRVWLYRDSLIMYITVPNQITDTHFAHLKTRFGKLLVKHQLAQKAMSVSTISRRILH